MAENFLITIIIAVKNAKDYLELTLASIRSQTYPRIEVIVVDGKSHDGTQSVIHANQDIISQWISEPDGGISDAFNKGVRLAKGDYINFQGAGDVLHSPHCIQQLFENTSTQDALVCGRILRVAQDGVTELWQAPKIQKTFNPKSLLFKMTLPHQALFTHRSFFDQYGEFDTKLKFAMDYELLLRAYHQFPKTILKNIIISRWREGGANSSPIRQILDEYHYIKQKQKIASGAVLEAVHHWSRFKYLIKDLLSIKY